MANHEHKDILGPAPPQLHSKEEGTTTNIFSEHHIVVGSIGVNKSPRTHQRFGIKPRDLPALIFLHQGQMYRHPKTVENPEKEQRYHFTWDSIIQFALQLGGQHSITQTTMERRSVEDDGGEGEVTSQEEATVQATENFFAHVPGQDIPPPTNEWDDFMAMVHIMFTECPGSVWVMLGLVLSAAGASCMSKKEKNQPKNTKKVDTEATIKKKKKTS
jgi:hypothetical protein